MVLCDCYKVYLRKEIKMADVTGPVTTFPGSLGKVPDGTMCDDCSEHLATHRIQGETDSFGAEWYDLCDDCLEEDCRVRREKANEGGVCEWCNEESAPLVPARDYDEGCDGPLYDVCLDCRDRQIEAIEDELNRSRDDDW